MTKKKVLQSGDKIDEVVNCPDQRPALQSNTEIAYAQRDSFVARGASSSKTIFMISLPSINRSGNFQNILTTKFGGGCVVKLID